MDSASSVQPFDPPGICALCHRILPLENDVTDLESISICGDCKFLFLEDGDTQSQHIQRRTPRIRRTRYTNSSESIENIFSHQFSNMINQSRHNPPHVPDIDNQSVDSVFTSSRTTPNASRRYRRVISDTESDGFDSVYGESDAISYGVYGGDSDASVDVHSFLGDSDTDIDPMHAGLNQWSSDDEWEEIEDENNNNNNNTLGSLIARVHLQRSLASENENSVHIRISERRRQRQVNITTTPFGDIMEQGHSGDYLDARSFEELVERLAEADNVRRGPPPASVSFVENLEKVVVGTGEYDGVGCAICKESFCVGGVVNRLPCFHVYHGSCIKPWLSSRNSCPLCRYELPTDDMEYENRKESGGHGLRVEEEIQEEGAGVESSFEGLEMVNDESGSGSGNGNGRGRGRWLFVVSLVGIGLALWLGNPGAIRGTGTGTGTNTGSHGQRGNRSRRWWSLF